MARRKTSTKEIVQYGLKGTIATMKNAKDFFRGTIYVSDGCITAIIKDGKAIPDELGTLPVLETKGTIFPGLIELHNHLSYNCLPLWDVPKKYSNRSQWSGIAEYQKKISLPMNALGKTRGYVEAIVRYVECKCLAAGVTTSQGIMLFSNGGIKKYYKGVVRNVEEAGNPSLPMVNAKIPDIASKESGKFLKHLKKCSCLLLHLSEGVDEKAHKHFEALKISKNNWAITDAFVGIHSTALKNEDFKILKEKGASMIWSPFSNLLLYGQTADIKSAKKSKINIGIGSDWSPSGSKNLLGELKVAKIFSEENNNLFSSYDIIAMATKNAAKIIKWDKELGTLEKGKRADFFVVEGENKNPFDHLLNCSERHIRLVVIDGHARFGDSRMMNKLNIKGKEERKVGTRAKIFHLNHDDGDPVVGKMTLSAAEKKLKKGLKNIRKLATALPKLQKVSANGTKFMLPGSKKSKSAKQEWFLVLDHNEEEGQDLRPHISIDGEPTMVSEKGFIKAVSPKELEPIELDPLTVADDKNYFRKIKAQRNLPEVYKKRLASFYK
jgi:cytosine/adenosine deaminase-related metal-dependent hydrolase